MTDIFDDIHNNSKQFIDLLYKKNYIDLWKKKDESEVNINNIYKSYTISYNINGIIINLIIIDDNKNNLQKYISLLKNLTYKILQVKKIPPYKVSHKKLNNYMVLKYKELMNKYKEDIYIFLYIKMNEEEIYYHDIDENIYLPEYNNIYDADDEYYI